MLERREARVGLDELQVERPGGCGADHDEDTGPLHLRCWVVVVERDEQPRLNLGGYWSTDWYNGNVLGSEIARGFDSLRLEPIAAISRNEITAAGEIRQESFNAQLQSRLVAAPSFAVVGARIDQAQRAGTLSGDTLAEVRQHVATAEKLLTTPSNLKAALAQLSNAERKSGEANPAVVQALQELADSLS